MSTTFSPWIVGITGTRRGLTASQHDQLRTRLKELREKGAILFCHGDCVGADVQAAYIAQSLGYVISGFPPSNPKYRGFFPSAHDGPPRSYATRNHNLVKAVDLLLACPKSSAEELRSGTWSAVRYARKIGKPVEIIV